VGGLRGGLPGGYFLLGAGLPGGDPEELADAGEGEEGEEGAEDAGDAEGSAIPEGEAEEEEQKQGGPDDGEGDDEAVDFAHGEEGLAALNDVGRDDDGEDEAGPAVEGRATEGDEDAEEEEGEDEDVGDVGQTDGGEGDGRMHAGVGASAEELAVVGDEDEGGDADALREFFEEEVSPGGSQPARFGKAFQHVLFLEGLGLFLVGR
jgi:hypothetical protein